VLRRSSTKSVEKMPGATSGPQIPIWTPYLSVGNAKLDEQHITLLVLGQNLLRLLEMDRLRNEQIQCLLNDIAGLVGVHDALEESVLEENGCPTLAEHKATHEVSRAKLAGLISDASNNSLDKADLAREIADWKEHHIRENDLPVKQYMKKNMTNREKSIQNA
jgi:hemerythrin-like metal-binding protein